MPTRKKKIAIRASLIQACTGKLKTRECQLHLPHVVVGVMPGRVGPDQSDDRCGQQKEAADALNVNELLDGHDQRARHQGLAQLYLQCSVCARRNSHRVATGGCSQPQRWRSIQAANANRRQPIEMHHSAIVQARNR